MAKRSAGSFVIHRDRELMLRDGKQEERVRNKRNDTEQTEKSRAKTICSVCSVSFRLFRILSVSFLLAYFGKRNFSAGSTRSPQSRSLCWPPLTCRNFRSESSRQPCEINSSRNTRAWPGANL